MRAWIPVTCIVTLLLAAPAGCGSGGAAATGAGGGGGGSATADLQADCEGYCRAMATAGCTYGGCVGDCADDRHDCLASWGAFVHCAADAGPATCTNLGASFQGCDELLSAYDQCALGACLDGRGACDRLSPSTCPSGEACTWDEGSIQFFCTAPGSRALGETCTATDGCAANLYCDLAGGSSGVCRTWCCHDGDCASGEHCRSIENNVLSVCK